MAVNENKRNILDEEQKLLENYKEYLFKKGLSKWSVSTYACRINRLLSTKCAGTCYTVGGLRNQIFFLIQWYSKGGHLYDVNDHNKTVYALKHLKTFFDENPTPSQIGDIDAYVEAFLKYE